MHYDSIDKKVCSPNNIGTLNERVNSNLNSEIAFLKEQLVTKDNYFPEKLFFYKNG